MPCTFFRTTPDCTHNFTLSSLLALLSLSHRTWHCLLPSQNPPRQCWTSPGLQWCCYRRSHCSWTSTSKPAGRRRFPPRGLHAKLNLSSLALLVTPSPLHPSSSWGRNPGSPLSPRSDCRARPIHPRVFRGGFTRYGSHAVRSHRAPSTSASSGSSSGKQAAHVPTAPPAPGWRNSVKLGLQPPAKLWAALAVWC